MGTMVTLGGGALAPVAEGSLGSLVSPNPAETPQTLQQQQKKKKGKKKGQRGSGAAENASRSSSGSSSTPTLTQERL